MNGKSWVALATLLAGAATSAGAATPPATSKQSDAAERERIVRERAEVQAAFQREETACQQNFLVTPCVDAARKTERDGLARLRREEVLLDEQARRQRAAERTQAIRERIGADEERSRKDAAAAASAPPRRAERSDLAETPGHAPPPRHDLPTPQPPVDPAARAAAAQENAERAAADRRAAQAHREAVERRNAERAKEGKVVAPLPTPPTPSGASSR